LAEFQNFIVGQIFAVLGSFGQIWADFHAFTMAESMPELGLKSSKPHNFSTVSPNFTCNGSLENYHPYLYPQKEFQKNLKFIAFIVACPRTQKPILVNNVLYRIR
jgi:hypothetical protein